MSTTQPHPIDVQRVGTSPVDLPPASVIERLTTTTSTTSAVDEPLPQADGAYAAEFALWLGVAAVGAAVARLTGVWRNRRDLQLPAPRWSPAQGETDLNAETQREVDQPRPPTTSPLWIGAGLMFGGSVVFPFATVMAIDRHADLTKLSAEQGLILMSAMYVATLFVTAAYHRALRGRLLPLLGLSRGWNLADLGVAALAVLIAIPLTNVAALLTQMMWESLQYKHETVHALLQLMERSKDSRWVPILAILNAVVLAPVFEELLFRGHLQTAIGIKLRSRGAAIAMTSLLFASIHETWMMPPIFVLSLMLGYVYERTNSLWVSILLHVAFNSVSTATFLMLRG